MFAERPLPKLCDILVGDRSRCDWHTISFQRPEHIGDVLCAGNAHQDFSLVQQADIDMIPGLQRSPFCHVFR